MKKLMCVAGLSILLIAFASCGGGDAEKGPQNRASSASGKTGSVTLVFSGNVGGMVNPCGCRIPLGGMARRYNVVNDIRSEAENVLVVDSGAMLFSSQFLYPPYDVIARRTSYFIAELVDDIGIDILNVASYDLANGPDSLLVFDETYDAKWVSANVVRRGTEDLVFDSGKTFTRGDFTVGVFGIMDNKLQGADMFDSDAPVDVLDPYESAKKEVAKLKGKVDIIVALAYMNIPNVKRIAEENPEINVIVMSHTRQHNPSSDHNKFQPEHVGDTLIIRCPDGGRVVGRLDLNVVEGSYSFISDEKYVDLRPESVRAKDPTPLRSTYHHEFIDLGSEIEHNPVIGAKIKEFTDKINAYTKANDIDYKVP